MRSTDAAGPRVVVTGLWQQCLACHGLGTYKRQGADRWWELERCQRCNGEGVVPKEETTDEDRGNGR